MKKGNQFTKMLLKLVFNSFLNMPSIDEYIDELKRSRTSIDVKIQKVNASLQETSKVIKELESELEDRATNLKKLQSEYERYSNLAEIEEEKASALLKQVELSVDKGKNTERWIGFAINIIAGLILFILGIILSPFFNKLFGITS